VIPCPLTFVKLIMVSVHIKENKKLEALENDGTIHEGDTRGVGFRYVY
jgi:hypothetical protein